MALAANALTTRSFAKTYLKIPSAAAAVTRFIFTQGGSFFDVVGAAKAVQLFNYPAVGHYFWFSVTGGSNSQTDPGLTGTGHQVALLPGDTAAGVATKFTAAVALVTAAFTATNPALTESFVTNFTSGPVAAPTVLGTAATVVAVTVGSAGDTSQDELVDFWINTASQKIETATGRKLKSQILTEVAHGAGTNLLLLREWPVLSTPFPQVFIDGNASFAADTEVPAASIRVADDNNSLLLLGQSFPRGYGNVKVVYTAGYATVPVDLENACLWLVTWYHKMRESGDIGRESKTKGDETITVFHKAPEDVRDTIQIYKRTEMPAAYAPIANR